MAANDPFSDSGYRVPESVRLRIMAAQALQRTAGSNLGPYSSKGLAIAQGLLGLAGGPKEGFDVKNEEAAQAQSAQREAAAWAEKYSSPAARALASSSTASPSPSASAMAAALRQIPGSAPTVPPQLTDQQAAQRDARIAAIDTQGGGQFAPAQVAGAADQAIQGATYQPQTTSGQVASNVAGFVPASLARGGNIVGNALRYGIAPGLVSKGLGRLGAALGPTYDAAGRIVGGVLGAGGVHALSAAPTDAILSGATRGKSPVYDDVIRPGRRAAGSGAAGAQV